MVQGLLGKNNLAINNLDKGISFDPSNNDTHMLRGTAKLAVGKRSGACADWREESRIECSMLSNSHINTVNNPVRLPTSVLSQASESVARQDTRNSSGAAFRIMITSPSPSEHLMEFVDNKNNYENRAKYVGISLRSQTVFEAMIKSRAEQC